MSTVSLRLWNCPSLSSRKKRDAQNAVRRRCSNKYRKQDGISSGHHFWFQDHHYASLEAAMDGKNFQEIRHFYALRVHWGTFSGVQKLRIKMNFKLLHYHPSLKERITGHCLLWFNLAHSQGVTCKLENRLSHSHVHCMFREGIANVIIPTGS